MRVSLTFGTAAVLLLGVTIALAAPAGLYEWLAIAPVVVEGECLGTYGKFAHFRIEAVLRGDGDVGTVIRVNVRRANRDRNRRIDKDALRFEAGLSYLLLLTDGSPAKAGELPKFEFVRGARGAREVPSEGGGALLDAVQRFIAIQDRNDDRATWREMGAMLEERDPVLIQTALDQFLKFRRGDGQLLGSLRPLLDHPAYETRERAALLIAQILERLGPEPIPDAALLQGELAAKARRDSAVDVRVAATRALNEIDSVAIDGILKEIARADPDQRVRYEAERLLYERERSPAPPGPDESGSGPPGDDPD